MGKSMTDLITWAPRMSVGVALLDEDHKRIMKLINKLHDAMIEGAGHRVLADIFRDLIAYISIHFDAEEELFERTGYQGAEEQQKAHRQMAQRTHEIYMQFQNDPESVKPMEVLYFLKDWWNDHIMNTDKKYAMFLNAHGIY